MPSAVLTQRATVVASGPELTEVRLTSPCSGCHAGCGMARVSDARLSVPTPATGFPAAGFPATGFPATGSPVRLVVSRRGLTKACALVFGFPLVGWLAVTAAVEVYWGEAAASLAGLAMLAWMLVGVRAFRPTLRRWVNIALIPVSHE